MESIFFLFFYWGTHAYNQRHGPTEHLRCFLLTAKHTICTQKGQGTREFFVRFFIQSNLAEIVRDIPINPMETIISSSYPITNSRLLQQPELSNVAAHEAFIQKFSQVKRRNQKLSD